MLLSSMCLVPLPSSSLPLFFLPVRAHHLFTNHVASLAARIHPTGCVGKAGAAGKGTSLSFSQLQELCSPVPVLGQAGASAEGQGPAQAARRELTCGSNTFGEVSFSSAAPKAPSVLVQAPLRNLWRGVMAAQVARTEPH